MNKYITEKNFKLKGCALRALVLAILLINCAYQQKDQNYQKDTEKNETQIGDALQSIEEPVQSSIEKDNDINQAVVFHQGAKRRLATSYSMSTITGTGLQSFAAGTAATITVISKDASGNLIGTGGDKWLVKITNECTKVNDYTCIGVSGAQNTLSSPISGMMTDKGDGTYTFTYTLPTTGKVSTQVYLASSTGCFVEYNGSSDFTGATLGSATESDISRDYGTGVVYGGLLDNISLKITTTILAPYTGTYTFDFVYDDGADVYLDGTMFLNQLGTPCHCTQTVTKSLVAGTYYSFYAKWGEIGGGATFTVNWAYGSVSSVQIPTSNQVITPLAGSSPFSFSVVSGICGDGFTTSTEVCDDGNTINGDGCSSTCAIEDNHVCINTSSSTTSVCTPCHVSWTPNSSKTECITDEITPGIVPFSSFYIALLCIGILLNFVLTKFFKYSSYGMYIMFAQFQMFMLTPLIGGYITKIVIDFYRLMYGMIFNFWFIFDWSVFINFGQTFGKYSYGFNWYLYLINMPSYSALSNMGKLLWIFMWLVAVYIIIGVATLVIGLFAKDSWAHKLSKFLFELMKNKMFMRLFMLSYCFMWLACMTEIGMVDNPNQHKSSYIFAMFTLVSLSVFLIFSGFMCGISSNQNWYKNMSFAHELFNGMRNDWKSRTFPVVSLLRSALFPIFVCGAYSKSMYISLSLMVGVQVFMLAYLVALRPHLHIKDLVVEVANDFVLFLGIVILYYLDRISRWANVVSWVYISFLMGCVALYVVCSLGALGHELWKLDQAKKLELIRKELKSAEVADENEDQNKPDEAKSEILNSNKVVAVPNTMV